MARQRITTQTRCAPISGERMKNIIEENSMIGTSPETNATKKIGRLSTGLGECAPGPSGFRFSCNCAKRPFVEQSGAPAVLPALG